MILRQLMNELNICLDRANIEKYTHMKSMVIE